MLPIFVSGLVIYQNKLLLIWHRKRQGWQQPGGKLNPNENLSHGLFRELKEETGSTSYRIIPPPNGHTFVCDDYQLSKLIRQQWVNLSTRLGINPFLQKKNLPCPLLTVVNEHFIDFFFVLSASSNKVHLNAKEHNDIYWFTMDDLLSLDINDKIITKFSHRALSIVNLNTTNVANNIVDRIKRKLTIPNLPNKSSLLEKQFTRIF